GYGSSTIHLPPPCSLFFFFTTPSPTQFYTLSLHDALPILLQNRLLIPPARKAELQRRLQPRQDVIRNFIRRIILVHRHRAAEIRSEEHTSELQSRENLVCRLLLEKKKKKKNKKLNKNIQHQ